MFFFVIIQGILLLKKPPTLSVKTLLLWALEEVIFLAGLTFWSYIRAHEPSINGLEKFMDFGFVNSILRAQYFPPKDMWFPPYPINYYYFGHYLTAMLTKLSALPSNITFNLMIATLFALTLSESFSIGMNLAASLNNTLKQILSGILSALLVTLAGNLHTIYTFFSPYPADSPKPPWELPFRILSFPNNYWYPNATRFIPFTIHEFPIYSFVVSDLHGHVLDIPMVLFTVALLFTMLHKNQHTNKSKKQTHHFAKWLPSNQEFSIKLIVLSFFIAVMYMTNAWDGAIYLLLAAGVFTAFNVSFSHQKSQNWKEAAEKFFQAIISAGLKSIPYLIIVFIGFVVFSFPFNLNFKPFVSGIGVMCAPNFLFQSSAGSYVAQKIGPFLFEPNHCGRSPWWMLLILYGFFYFFVIVFIGAVLKIKSKLQDPAWQFVLILIIISTILIIVPEFIYVKDIYPQHYRANTMFKLVYQAFMLLSLVSGFVIAAIIKPSKNIVLYFITIVLLGFVFIYPYFAINSYYGDLKTYKGLDGTAYLKDRYPDDYKAIQWMNAHIQGQPTIVEAQGDSYTDYERISANTGLPTVLGWTVHEWLWRGTYDIPAPRIEDVRRIYEDPSIGATRQLLKKYNVKYVYIGGLERQKYPNIQENKFRSIGKIVYLNDSVTIYQL